MSGVTVSVVIPVYNSESTLAVLLGRLEPVLRAHASDFEVIFVDDGSRDGSWQVVQALAGKYSFVTGIRLMRNFGQHNAVLCGIRAAKNQVIVTLDDDLQNPPEEIPALLAQLDRGYDVVYGTPNVKQHGVLRNLASGITKMALQSAMGVTTARGISAFRAFRTPLRNGFGDFRGSYVSIDVLLTWATSRFAAIPVRHEARREGRSNYTVLALLRHAINMLTGFSTIPLRLASVLGFTFMAFGGCLLIFTLVRYFLQGVAVPGFVFLVCTITILSGAQLFALGVIGEYLARMHVRMMEKPTYTISCVAGAEIKENDQLLRSVVAGRGQA